MIVERVLMLAPFPPSVQQGLLDADATKKGKQNVFEILPCVDSSLVFLENFLIFTYISLHCSKRREVAGVGAHRTRHKFQKIISSENNWL